MICEVKYSILIELFDSTAVTLPSFWQLRSNNKLPVIIPTHTQQFIKSTPQILTNQLYTPNSQQIPHKPISDSEQPIIDSRYGPISLDYTDFHNTTMQSGQLNLNWGIIHLYREAGTTESSTQEEKIKAVQEDDGTIAGVVCVPGSISVTSFLTFITPALDSIVQLRMLRDASPNRNLVLIRFKKASDADQFRRMFLGKPYNENKDSELCQVVPISSIKLNSTTTPPFTFPYTASSEAESSNLVELPTCPICLERLDGTHSGLITVSCGHTHHCTCLLRWGDSRCPVCRSTSSRARKPAINLMQCAVCRSEANLWQCLICGNVGCGRYQGGHAHSHYDESHHAYSLEIKTQRIWSYLNDEYVHRLIQRDGKLVELPSLIGREEGMKGSGSGPNKEKEEEMNKIELVSIEIDSILTTQLISQREFYEELITKSKLDYTSLGQKLESDQLANTEVVQQKNRLEIELKSTKLEAEKEKSTLSNKLSNLMKKSIEEEIVRKKERNEQKLKLKEIEKELKNEKLVTTSLTNNLNFLNKTLTSAANETTQLRSQMEDLQEQMRDVMFALTARDQIESQVGNELVGGDVSVPVPPVVTPTVTKKKKKR